MILPAGVANWPDEWRELFVERAGIMEFDGGMTRKRAEQEAELDIRRMVERQP
ncbi:MAG: hypothetical protein JWQ87_2222 [Candidatus Sulfotelmatobacter sp.]|nr:hypothetical protein [Candidatus Sulfotelmatobacter sp.]